MQTLCVCFPNRNIARRFLLMYKAIVRPRGMVENAGVGGLLRES